MPDLTQYELADGIATITLDDGKANALSRTMLRELAGRLDQAEADEAVVVLTGRPQRFSAGFDLRTAPDGWPEMLRAGAQTAVRLLSFPRPTVIASTGHAVAMGALLLLSADVRIGARGDFKIGLNEVAIGLTLPWFGIALARHRLTPAAFARCTATGVLLDSMSAREAGFLDELADADGVMDAAHARARELVTIDGAAHRATKLRVREGLLAEVNDGIARLGDPDRQP